MNLLEWRENLANLAVTSGKHVSLTLIREKDFPKRMRCLPNVLTPSDNVLRNGLPPKVKIPKEDLLFSREIEQLET